MPIIGVDIGGTHFRIGVVDDSLQVSHFERLAVTDIIHPADPLGDLAAFLSAYIARASLTPKAIVLGFPATVDKGRSTVLQAPNLPFLENLPVKEALSRRLSIPVLLERDVNLTLYYDRKYYGLEHHEVLVAIYFGTGIGNAVMIHQQLLLGKNGVAAELGHIPVEGSILPCGCGNVGCMENLAGGKYLVHLQKSHFPDTPIDAMFTRHGSSPEIKAMLHYMAMTIATEANIFDPDCILIGGGIPSMADFPWDTLVEETLSHTRKPFPAASLQLLRSEDFPEKGIIGATLYAKEHLS